MARLKTILFYSTTSSVIPALGGYFAYAAWSDQCKVPDDPCNNFGGLWITVGVAAGFAAEMIPTAVFYGIARYMDYQRKQNNRDEENLNPQQTIFSRSFNYFFPYSQPAQAVEAQVLLTQPAQQSRVTKCFSSLFSWNKRDNKELDEEVESELIYKR